MLLVMLPFVGGFLGAALAGTIVGCVAVWSQYETVPGDERQIWLLTLRLRHPWRARLPRWMGEDLGTD